MRSLVAVYAVDEFTEGEIEVLEGEVGAMADRSDNGVGHPSTGVTTYLVDTDREELHRTLTAAEPCPFCELAAEDVRSEFVLANRWVFVVKSKDPKAEKHLLVIPRRHVETILAADDDTLRAMHHLMHRAVVDQKMEDGFRLVVNTGAAGKQVVPHLHWHLLSGKEALEDGFTRRIR